MFVDRMLSPDHNWRSDLDAAQSKINVLLTGTNRPGPLNTD